VRCGERSGVVRVEMQVAGGDALGDDREPPRRERAVVLDLGDVAAGARCVAMQEVAEWRKPPADVGSLVIGSGSEVVPVDAGAGSAMASPVLAPSRAPPRRAASPDRR
jgi:hypothetical protein